MSNMSIDESTGNPTLDIVNLLNKDGKEYIRVDNRAKTLLGKMLDSQSIVEPIVHPKLGIFLCVEGFRYFITTKNAPEQLHTLIGYSCRKLIKEMKRDHKYVKINIKNFYDHIKYANWLKIEASPDLKEKFVESSLPFRMFYIDNDKTSGHLILSELSLLDKRIVILEELRQSYKKDFHYQMECPDCSEILANINK